MLSCSTKEDRNIKSIDKGDIATLYEIPYLNDHAVIYNDEDKKWHVFGIINPQTAFIHLTADSLTQKGWVREEQDFTDNGHEIWAPHIVKHKGLYYMFYTTIGVPRKICYATSKDLNKWDIEPEAVIAFSSEDSDNLKNKDPMVFRDEENKQWIMYYSMMKDKENWVVGYSTSNDLRNWSDYKICFDEHTTEPNVESPFVVKWGDYYYMFLSARPWPIGGEDIFKSKTPFFWEAKDLVKRFDPWHAAEIIQDLDGSWYMTLASGMEGKDLAITPLVFEYE